MSSLSLSPCWFFQPLSQIFFCRTAREKNLQPPLAWYFLSHDAIRLISPTQTPSSSSVPHARCSEPQRWPPFCLFALRDTCSFPWCPATFHGRLPDPAPLHRWPVACPWPLPLCSLRALLPGVVPSCFPASAVRPAEVPVHGWARTARVPQPYTRAQRLPTHRGIASPWSRFLQAPCCSPVRAPLHPWPPSAVESIRAHLCSDFVRPASSPAAPLSTAPLSLSSALR
jgi:hypothetical protein